MASWSSRWCALPCTLRDGFVATGLDKPDLFSLAFGADEGEREYGALSRQVGYEEDDGAELLGGLVEVCSGRVRRAPTRIAAVSDAEITVWAMKRQKTVRAGTLIPMLMKPPPEEMSVTTRENEGMSVTTRENEGMSVTTREGAQ